MAPNPRAPHQPQCPKMALGPSPNARFAPVPAVRYPTGRSNDWVKKTCAQRETLTIAGFALDGSKWDGLFVGRRKGGDLVYAGKVDHGFDKVSAADLRKRLEPLVRKTQAFKKRVAHKGIWVEPKLLAEIEYRAKSAEGKVRHPFFRAFPRTCRSSRNRSSLAPA